MLHVQEQNVLIFLFVFFFFLVDMKLIFINMPKMDSCSL